MTTAVLQQFGFIENEFSLQPHGSGLINTTWVVEMTGTGEKFILQKVNAAIFKNPADIAFNIRQIADYLKQHHPDYLFVAPVKTVDGREMVTEEYENYRLFPFVKGSQTIDVVKTPEQAFEAARQFGKFTKLLSGLDPRCLRITLPDFHNLSLRYQQFEMALQKGNRHRLQQSRELTGFIQDHRSIVGEYEFNKTDFKTRATHHDTKISNVLFDKQDKGICVIDLDTVMPGCFISDLGDMMRTYLSPVNEEESDFSKIEIRPGYYQAIIEGYLSEMAGELLDFEKKYFLFAGKFMIYMQAIRFLTDHLNDDVYYGSKYEGHNFLRAGNQLTLLQRLFEFEAAGKPAWR